MISLAQMTVAGIAGYMVAIFGTARRRRRSAWAGRGGWRCLLAIAVAATVAATFIGWLSVRTEGIYTIMITLAIGVAFYYLCLQNYSVFNGFQGLQQVLPADAGRHLLARADCRSTTWCCSGRSPATSSSSTCCARRSASRCRASATTRAA